MSRTNVALALAGVVALTAACSQPPSDAISAGEEAQQAALAAGAEEYAPEALAAVSQARAALDAELTAQGERMSIRRSYGAAEELAMAYQTAAEAATAAATAGMEQARMHADSLVAAGRALLEETTALLSTAPAGKGTHADLAAMRMDLEGAGTLLDEAEAAAMEDSYLDASAKAQTAIETITRVRDAVSGAQAARAG